MEASRSKVFEMVDLITFYIFPAVVMFCKVNILLFSSLLNKINASGARWVGGRWVDGSVVGSSVVGGFNKTLFKHKTFIIIDSFMF